MPHRQPSGPVFGQAGDIVFQERRGNHARLRRLRTMQDTRTFARQSAPRV